MAIVKLTFCSPISYGYLGPKGIAIQKEIILREMVRTTARSYGMKPGSLVRHIDGRLGRVVDIDADHAKVRWTNVAQHDEVCFGDLEVVFGQELEVP